jgi:hypothetical protein
MRYRHPTNGQFLSEKEAKEFIKSGEGDSALTLENLEDYSDEEDDNDDGDNSPAKNDGDGKDAPNGNPADNKKAYMAVGIFGAPGSGKSSLTWEWMLDYDAAGGKVIAIDRARQFGKFSVWPGMAHLNDWLMNEILGKFHGLLVLDDADLYLDANASADWKDLIVSFRHHGVDLLASSRRPQDIPTKLLSCLEHGALFRMAEPRAIKKCEDWIGEDIAAHIPKVKHKFLMVDVFARTYTIEETRAMNVATVATGKNLR